MVSMAMNMILASNRDVCATRAGTKYCIQHQPSRPTDRPPYVAVQWYAAMNADVIECMRTDYMKLIGVCKIKIDLTSNR